MIAALVALGDARAAAPPLGQGLPPGTRGAEDLPRFALDSDAVVFLLPDADEPQRQRVSDGERASTIAALERCLEASRQAIESRGIRVFRTGAPVVRAPRIELVFPPGMLGTLLISKDSSLPVPKDKPRPDFKEGRETAEGLLRRVEKYFGPPPQPASQPN